MPPVRIRQRGKAPKGTLKRLIKMLFKKHPVVLIISAFCILFNVFSNLAGSIFANFITVVLESSIREGSNPFAGSHNGMAMGFTISTNLTVLLIVLGVIYGLGVLASWTWNRTMAIVTQKFMNDIRKVMFNHMQDLPIKYFDTKSHGEIMSLYTNDIDTIRQFISQSLPSALQAGAAVTFVLITMLMNSIWMTLVVIAGAIAMLLSTIIIGGKSSKYFMKQQRSLAVDEGKIEETIKG